MNERYQKNIYCANVNECLSVSNVTQIKSGIMINNDVSATIQKKIMHVKKIILGILLHLIVKMVNI